MESNSTKFKMRLGLFLSVGFALFVLAIFYIGKQKNLFNPVFRLTTTFYNVSGLQVGNNVRFSGINTGTVDDVKIINDTTVKVDMLMEKGVQKYIKVDCKVTIGSEGIIGDRVLNITQGTSEAASVKDGQYLSSFEPIETDAIMASLKVTAENAEVITEQLAEIMIKVNSGNGTLGRLIQDSTIAENISQTIKNLKTSTKGLDENMQAAKHNFLLRGYFKKKNKTAEKEMNEKKQLEQKAKDEKNVKSNK